MKNPDVPEAALVDTSFLACVFDHVPNDPVTPYCKLLWDAMLAGNTDIMIAAPSLVELMRQDHAKPPLHVARVRSVPFDQQAAKIVVDHFPLSVLKSLKDQTRFPMSYLKYDTLIVACAKRWNAGVFVGLDNDQAELANAVGLHFVHPLDWCSAPPIERKPPTFKPPVLKLRPRQKDDS